MNLVDRVRGDFDTRDWQRGQEYYRSGDVRLLRRDRMGVDATVQGSFLDPYLVRLDWSEAEQGTLLGYCTCPRFDDAGACKHIAATVLAVGAKPSITVPGRQRLVFSSLGFADAHKHAGAGYVPADHEYFEVDDLDGENNDRFVQPARPNVPTPKVDWKKRLATWKQASTLAHHAGGAGAPWSKPRQLWYLLHLTKTQNRGWPTIVLYQRPLNKNGSLGKLKTAQFTPEEAGHLPDEVDRKLIALLVGNERNGYGSYGYYKLGEFAIAPAMFDILLPQLCASGRFGWLPGDSLAAGHEVNLMTWDDGPRWTPKVRVTKNAREKAWEVTAELARGDQAEDFTRPLLLLKTGLAIFSDHIARFDPGPDFQWIIMLRQGPLIIPFQQESEFVATLATAPSLPDIEWPAELGWQEVKLEPQPRVIITRSKRAWQPELECQLTFQYGDKSAPFGGGDASWYDASARTLIRRNPAAENAARDELLAAGANRAQYPVHYEKHTFLIPPNHLPQVVARLTTAGWPVEADGHRVRQAGAVSMHVSSGVDWFDLEGTCDFGGVTASLPELLAALKRGEQYVTLDDGSRGLLPEHWLARYAPLAELGQLAGEHLRFVPSQAALLDALLAAQKQVDVKVDKGFAKLRDRLNSFNGIRPLKEPRSFVGELRPYQRNGLGWLKFLDEFAFGGCLADDMGLGKTIQVLAWLEARRAARTAKKSTKGQPTTANAEPSTSLVVAPRSLVFNWVEEARRFTPKLRVLNYTGLDRAAHRERFSEFDLVVTTYGTLRQDITDLWKFNFDYAILDEAQAIKNSSSQASKACRLLPARRRLAMTGTPVENHLGELWSLFEFLNPGMLGRNSKLQDLYSPGRRSRIALSADESDAEQQAGLAVLSRALRPFMLRRTKEQVLTELPPKTEQTLYCELDRPERKQYDELREHYRRALLERVQQVGLNKSKVHVLEALLRLRQAACHPGLLDAKKAKTTSSKIDTLLEQLEEVLAGGHKALVFSQFTSLLAIVRHQLDQRKIVYEYLDGKTTKRQEKVERFQTDPTCPLFLISLKAGGLGLNLTAADYIFILDPWWNPAVEAQAVDRAHRMGQERNVFAYRLIACDTIEEKILQLQEHKRGLADAIISAEGSLLQSLTPEDLQILLS